MQQDEKYLENTLFRGFTLKEITLLLDVLKAETIKLTEKRIIIYEGDSNPYIFSVLSGEAYGAKYDDSGREVIYNHFSQGSIFGDVLAVSSSKESPVTVIAYPETELLKIRFDNLVSSSAEVLDLRSRLLRNLTSELSNKFFELQERVDCLVAPTLRNKIIAFLENESRRQKSKKITVAFKRERLAAYLSTDRSALSRELSNMKRDGLIDYDKNLFTLIV